jgi:hypothetical protein
MAFLAPSKLTYCTFPQVIAYLHSVLRIRDVYPGSRILIFTHPGSRIPDPKTATKERGEKKIDVIPFYQCCGSGMFIPDPVFYPSRIPDLGSRIPDPKKQQKREVKKN